MNKIMTNELGEDAERRRLDQWFKRHQVNPDAQNELLIILYGKPVLNKENI